MGDREQVDQLQRTAGEVPVARLSRVSQSLPEVNLTALQHCQGVGPKRFNQFHFHIGMALRVAVQEIRNDALNELGRGSDLQHVGAPAPQLLRPLVDRAGIVEEAAAVPQQLLAFAGQHEPPPDAIEQLKALCYRELNPAVLMMKSAEDRLSSELAEPLDRPMARRILTQGQMRSNSVVQQGLRTPTGLAFENFCIDGTRGLAFAFASMGRSARLAVLISVAR